MSIMKFSVVGGVGQVGDLLDGKVNCRLWNFRCSVVLDKLRNCCIALHMWIMKFCRCPVVFSQVVFFHAKAAFFSFLHGRIFFIILSL